MTTLFKPTRPYPLPPCAEVVAKDGRPHARVREKGKTVLYPLSANGAAYLKPAAKWAADVRFADGTRKRVRFSPNRDAAALMLAELLKRIENEKAGVIDRTAPHRKRPLASHLSDWLDSLRANGRDQTYLGLKTGRVRAVVEGCGWLFTGDMSADRLETYLAGLRSARPDLPPIPPGVETFTGSEVGRLLGGVTRQTVSILVRRHRLTGTGNGKARRFPLATVEELRRLRVPGHVRRAEDGVVLPPPHVGQDLAVATAQELDGAPTEDLEELAQPDHVSHPLQQRGGVGQLGLHVHCLVAEDRIGDQWRAQAGGRCLGEAGVDAPGPLHRRAHPVPVLEADVVTHADLIPVVEDRGPREREEQAMEQLEPMAREAILAVRLGLTSEEAGARWGVPPATARQRMYRALNQVRALLLKGGAR